MYTFVVCEFYKFQSTFDYKVVKYVVPGCIKPGGGARPGLARL